MPAAGFVLVPSCYIDVPVSNLWDGTVMGAAAKVT